jgi:(E)-4-hydroxy-3-methylbut-2-enyl-diphosphate synthase
MTVAAYQQLSEAIDCPLHLGITEAGALRTGTVKSAIGMGNLLWAGIGDTIRVSLAADPVEEIKVGYDILKSLGLRSKGVNLIACPSCSRQNFDVISVVNALEQRLEDITTPIDVSVVGCIVNGPGEAFVADIGLTGATPANMAYVDGQTSHKISNDNLVDELEAMVRRKVAEKDAAQQARNSVAIPLTQIQ